MSCLRPLAPARTAILAVTFALLPLAAFAQAPAPAKLSVTVTPLGAAASDKPLPVTAEVEVDIKIRNDGETSAANVTVTVKLDGVKAGNEDGWTPDGDDLKLEIPSIKAGGEITRRLGLTVAMAPMPPGRKAEITAEVRSGDITVQDSAGFRTADCAAAFHAELTRVRIGPLDRIRTLADAYRVRDAALPRKRFFPAAKRKGDLATLERLAAVYMARATADPEFRSEGMRYTVVRWTNELRAYTGQEPNPGLCATSTEHMIAGIRRTIVPITSRLDPPQKAALRALGQLRKTTGAKEDETTREIALRIAEAAGAKIENPPTETLATLEAIANALKDKTATDEQRDQLSLSETVAWIEAQAARAKRFSEAIEGTITGIGDAQKANCICAF